MGCFRDWAVGRCKGLGESWWGTVCDTLRAAFHVSLADRLGLSRLGAGMRLKERTSHFNQEQELSQQAMMFATTLASGHFWANVQYRWTLPHAMPVYLIANFEEREAAVNQVQQLVLAVIKTSELVQSGCASKAVKQMLNDVGWHRSQFPRECMAYIVQSAGDPECPNARAIAEMMVGGSHSTWGVLESAFSYLRFRSQAQSKTEKLADFTRFCYAILNPYAEEAGMPQILPSSRDWLTCFMPENCEARQKGLDTIMSANSTTMPTGTPASSAKHLWAETKEGKWKLSGPLAHQRSSAAGMWLYSHALKPRGWQHAPAAWTCAQAECGTCLGSRPSKPRSLKWKPWSINAKPRHLDPIRFELAKPQTCQTSNPEKLVVIWFSSDLPQSLQIIRVCYYNSASKPL